ncbi:hypothetical protein PGTUg99_026845 [Puccinia graminis f. sp. tritici]|uniref:Uncharacterized protein n=1 Tax=Puccinia graminis f. sp. tritici TaxID=56615 RepID=A0A5B0RJ10_PUCGR|nr:hypothetical protein PGTUg99_026845 [Puccinia graminis f. sp. tritici]
MHGGSGAMMGGSGAWVANLAVGFNFQFGHSGGSGASFGGCLAKLACVEFNGKNHLS